LVQGQSASAGDVHDLLARARQLFPGRSLQGFEFRLKAVAGGAQFLELRKQTGWGAFKEAMGIGRATRDAERRNALYALPAAYLNGANAQQAFNRDAARALVSRTETAAIAIESDSTRIAANPMGSLLAAYSAGDKFDRFEFLECLDRVANSFNLPLNDGSGTTKNERLGAAALQIVVSQLQQQSDDQLRQMYRTFVAHPGIMSGPYLSGIAAGMGMLLDNRDLFADPPSLQGQPLDAGAKRAKALEYANLLADPGAVAAAFHGALVDEMTRRNLLRRVSESHEAYEFENRIVTYNDLDVGAAYDFLIALGTRTFIKGNTLEAILEMKAESLAGRAS
jgi:hypothetical protein